jgi:hypothetical protein
MNVGSADAASGTRADGYLSGTDLPTGRSERLPVVVVEGAADGPTVWVTGAIHGDEPTGTAAIHEFADRLRPDSLAGTVVCVPVMNPAGLRTNERTSYYHGDDPNRYFRRGDGGETPPRTQQLVCERVYDEIRESADAVVSLHTSWIQTHPYTIRPRVSYGRDRDEAAAAALSDRVGDLAEAFGLPVVNQFGREETDRRSLSHTLTGAAVADGIAAFTPELGGRFVVETDARAAAVAGLRNVLVASGMLDEPASTATEFGLDADGPLKRRVHPHTDTAGIVRYRVREGARITAGETVAAVVDQHGRTRAEIETEYSGYVLSRHEGAAVYENDPLLDVAVPDDEPLLWERSD